MGFLLASQWDVYAWSAFLTAHPWWPGKSYPGYTSPRSATPTKTSSCSRWARGSILLLALLFPLAPRSECAPHSLSLLPLILHVLLTRSPLASGTASTPHSTHSSPRFLQEPHFFPGADLHWETPLTGAKHKFFRVDSRMIRKSAQRLRHPGEKWIRGNPLVQFTNVPNMPK